MKDYLSSSDRDAFLCFIHMLNKAESMIERKDTYSKEEITNIKKAVTWGCKAMESVIIRQNPTSKKTLGSMIENTKAFLDYSTMTDVIKKRKSAEIDALYEENREYYRLVELIMYYNCNGCDKCHNDCDFYKEFELHLVPAFDAVEKFGECKYSYKLNG
jgi:hypothetical protein